MQSRNDHDLVGVVQDARMGKRALFVTVALFLHTMSRGRPDQQMSVKRHYRSFTAVAVLLALLLVQYGCGGGGGGSDGGSASPSGVSVSGTVQAPGGVIALNRPATLRRLFARLLVSDAVADLPGVTIVGAGVTINLIRIDDNGNRVGVIATTTTDSSGNYTFTAPAGFTPAANYIVEAASSNLTLQSFVTGTTVNVDPYTHATVTLVTGAISSAGASITGVSTADVAAVQQTVLQTSGDVSTTATTASQLVSGLTAAIRNDLESNNIVTSIASTGSITGTVTDSGGAPVANVQIMVRTFGNQTTQAITRTDASGAYTVHAPAGDYIIGAINDTAGSTAASQWWTGSGGATSLFAAGKVTVGSTAVTRNFSLAQGGRISGTVTAGSSSTTLAGVTVTLCDFTTGQTLMFVRTLPDGTYNFNVAAGTYYLSFRNSTLAPYATAVYNGTPGGGANKTQAQKFTINPGDSVTASMGLVLGNSISGSVTDPTTGAAAGIPVRFQDSTGAFAESLRTGVDGSYRMWVQPGTYNILTRGQQASGVDASSGNVSQSFNAAVGTITATVTDGTNAVSQAFAYLYDATGGTPTYNMVGYEVSNGDGTVTLYAPTSYSKVVLSIAVNDGRTIGSNTYYGASALTTPTSIPSGTRIPVPAAGSTTALGTLALPAGQVLSGTVTNSSTGASRGNSIVQVRMGGIGGAFRVLNTRSMSDGSYTASLPSGGTVTRLLACNSSPNSAGTGGNSTTPGSSAGSYAYTAAFTVSSATTEDLSY